MSQRGCLNTKTLLLKGKDGAEFNVSVFDEVENPRCVLQFAHGKKLAFPENERPFAWLSRDKEQVRAFTADPMSGYTMCVNFYASFLFGIHNTYKPKNLNAISKSLPIYLLSGDKDPVGEFGEGVKRLYEIYKSTGLNVEYKLYKDARHKILSELNREEVMLDMLDFVNRVCKK